jgi:hypothetical protein
MPEIIGTIPVNDYLILDPRLQVAESDGRGSALDMVSVNPQVNKESGEHRAVVNVMTSHCDAVWSGRTSSRRTIE